MTVDVLDQGFSGFGPKIVFVPLNNPEDFPHPFSPFRVP
jgi:hypothetical protein